LIKAGSPKYLKNKHQLHNNIFYIDSNAVTLLWFSYHNQDLLMPVLTIRNIDTHTRDQIKVRAAQTGHSMEAEVRRILTDTVRDWEQQDEEQSGLDFVKIMRSKFTKQDLAHFTSLILPQQQPLQKPTTDFGQSNYDPA